MVANVAANKLKKVENNIFDLIDDAEDIDPAEWVDMPAFINEDKEAEFRVIVRFRNMDDAKKFALLIEDPSACVKGKSGVKSIWFPMAKSGERGSNSLLVWMDEDSPEVKSLA